MREFTKLNYFKSLTALGYKSFNFRLKNIFFKIFNYYNK